MERSAFYKHEDDWDTVNPMMHDIAAFHEKFELEYQGKPRFLPLDLHEFRIKFMHEELTEYNAARSEMILEKQLDALVDLVYVALGTAYLHGFDFNEAWNRVHKANMEKIRTKRFEDSTRGSAFDVVKPEDWVPPYLKDLA